MVLPDSAIRTSARDADTYIGIDIFWIDSVPFEMLKFVAKSAYCENAVTRLAYEPVIVEPLRPKLTPFELLKVNADASADVVPADRLMLACVDAAVAVAVMVDPLRPKLTLCCSRKRPRRLSRGSCQR